MIVMQLLIRQKIYLKKKIYSEPMWGVIAKKLV